MAHQSSCLPPTPEKPCRRLPPYGYAGYTTWEISCSVRTSDACKISQCKIRWREDLAKEFEYAHTQLIAHLAERLEGKLFRKDMCYTTKAFSSQHKARMDS